MLKVAFLLICITAVYCDVPFEDYDKELQKVAPEIHKLCQIYTGVTENDIDKVKRGNFNAKERTQRYTACLWLSTGVCTSDLEIDKARTQQIRPSQLQVLINCLAAAKQSGANKEAYQILWDATKCTHDDDPSAFVIF